eukprot:TRINITY_DN11065_c0_g1_i3.p1 TRINITY_DN11065_c0_g1~~TRINITY_DN11065_c0_g1_i3.p1  ORF type:complete len:226 (+),score=47.27 TRINITY_DN11065_c0_g1_i3:368-1045(+)
MSTLLPMSGQLGISSNSIPYEAAKQLLGEDLLVNIECQSKEVDKGEEGGSEVSGGTTITGGFNSIQQQHHHQQQPPFNDDLFGHQIYQAILGKYCRTTRINQQLADVLPNYSAMHGLGLIEYDYQFHYQQNPPYSNDQQQQEDLFSNEQDNSVDIHAFQESSKNNYDDDVFTPQEKEWALVEENINDFSGIERNFESGNGNFSAVQNFEDGGGSLNNLRPTKCRN